jgi:hypothetical protein
VRQIGKTGNVAFQMSSVSGWPQLGQPDRLRRQLIVLGMQGGDE